MTTGKLIYLITRIVRGELSGDDYRQGLPVVMQDADGIFYEPWVTVRRTTAGPVLVIEPRYGEEDAAA